MYSVKIRIDEEEQPSTSFIAAEDRIIGMAASHLLSRGFGYTPAGTGMVTEFEKIELVIQKEVG